MINRQLFTYKFSSSRLKEFGYNIDITFNEAKGLKEIVALADNQMLRSIRDITNRNIDYDALEELYKKRDALKRGEKFSDDERSLTEIQQEIYDTLFIPEYITVVIDHPKHYDYIFENGIFINGVKYERLSCPAGKARVSTVILCSSVIIDELERRLNNNRDLEQEIAPNKFNAYFGLASSATKLVTEPRFIVVKDFENEVTFKAHYVTETDDWNADDLVETKDVTVKMNRTDGMGLISYSMAQKWAEDLDLDYVPSQFCVRQSFIKGLLCVFPIEEFCEKVNGGNYVVDTIYGEKADLREYDVILTESQFKLWRGYKNVQEYIDFYRANKLYWGISQHARKEDKNILRLNYQFIQTLNLGQKDIENLSEKFVDWLLGVSYDNFNYTLLFLLGVNNSEESIRRFMRDGQQYWIKALIVCPELRHDKYICKKIKELLRKKIHDACMGDIFVDGNFQPLVSDPYGFMQHVCGLQVTGLLKDGEFYSNYWNMRGVQLVDGMRSPLTFRSEHVLLNLRNDVETNFWYRYCTSGIILNYHGHETVNFGGADFDYDILATTSSAEIISGVYRDELPMYYEAPKPESKKFTKRDLYEADKFAFGSIIGSITNKGSNAYALLPRLEELYGKESREYQITYERLIQCCKAQSAQIDKAKIGKAVKGIPEVWIKYRKEPEDHLETLDEKANRELHNSILLNRHPYFFRYRYKDCRQTYSAYMDENNMTCQQRFGVTLDELLVAKRHTRAESEFIENLRKYMPVTDSDSPMNLLCKYIEGINFDISNKLNAGVFDKIDWLKSDRCSYSAQDKEALVDIVKMYLKIERKRLSTEGDDKKEDREKAISALVDDISAVCSNFFAVTNCLVDYFYRDRPSSNKDLLWMICGQYIFKNLKRNLGVETVLFPLPHQDGDIEYMGDKFALEEVAIN